MAENLNVEKLIDKHLTKRKTYLTNLLKQIGDPNYKRKGSTFVNKFTLSQGELELLANIYSCNIKQTNPTGDGVNYKLIFF